MTLDKAIKHCEGVAERLKNSCKRDWMGEDDKRCAEEHRQLAEWLKELKQLKEQEPCEDCISRNATVEQLCKVAEFMDEKRNGLGSPYVMAALFIQDNRAKFPSVTPKQRWIPVSERLPEEKINPITEDFYEYQCTYHAYGVYDVRSYKYGNGHWWRDGGIMDDCVIAWRESPEPYTENSEEATSRGE